MTPLKTFQKNIQPLLIKPYSFWSEKEQQKMQKAIETALTKIKQDLGKKELTDTEMYRRADLLLQDVQDLEKNELFFVQHLGNLLELYRHGKLSKNLESFLTTFASQVTLVKNKVMEHHLMLDALKKRGQKVSSEEKNQKDLETIQNIGVFYVLEFTLQVLFEFQRISDEDKVKLLDEGLRVKAGNLPAYRQLEDTFRKELCYQVFDDKLRSNLFKAFYKLEEVLFSENLEQIGQAIREFNLSLLIIYQEKGLENFEAKVYSPFGNNISIKELIKNI